ncbi:ATP-binding protein [Cohnella faecalis]|uniref:histidine kinase n=1 Tax=Cohnella faecalis TaxID=2315694 RepID=A0A398CNX3_9BACL|nr:HAMP domain-containing sensor histidine kinase [Cohnella faecalis]RIE02448.1 sensor histidine kinase [Cohnella faecalis]
MGQITARLRNLSFKASFVLYVTACVLSAAALSAGILHLTTVWNERIYSAGETTGATYYLTTKDGERLGDGVVVNTDPPWLSASDKRKVAVLQAVSAASIPVVFSVCVVVSAFLFYRNKLKKPLALLTAASGQIEQNNLDFSVAYGANDEMGRLCDSFEKMRAALRENQLEMWRQVEERKRLNAAFSHDLRTPLTVLKGHSDMLLKYVPDGKMSSEKVAATAAVIKSHILRLENYVDAMSRLQKLEDIAFCKAYVTAGELVERLHASGEILCAGNRLQVDNALADDDSFHVDVSFVMQVYENLLSNAARYAQSQIRVTLAGEGMLSLTVSDDGHGFSGKDLLEATKPFYRSSDSSDKTHFGMGLTICKVLCEKHGGSIRLYNDSGGAAVKAVF